jgi:hippurate hydrolase
MRSLLLLTAAVAALASPASAQTPPADLRAAVAADYAANLGALWDHFHRNPELSGLEVQTAARMARELRALGYEVTENVGGTGVVAVLRNGAGPTVLVRADMDGLPVREASGLANASTVTQTDVDGVEKPVMHACGHDVHITALVGTARQMMARRDAWSGTLVLIAQPAEEKTEGAIAMLRDGLYSRFPKPDYALGFHVTAGLPAGKVEVPEAIAYSSSDSVNVTVRGVGGHGAYPHMSVDPILVAAQMVVALQSIRSREINPLEGAVVTVGAIHGGVKHNIIPDTVEMQLTLRSDSPEVRAQLMRSVERIALNTARAFNVPEDRLPTVVHAPGLGVPPTINDTPTALFIRDAVVAGMGADAIVTPPRGGMGGEDFAWYGQPETGVKAVYLRVGGTPADQMDTVAAHHSALFRISPEPAVTTGVEAMVLGALALMPKR